LTIFKKSKETKDVICNNRDCEFYLPADFLTYFYLYFFKIFCRKYTGCRDPGRKNRSGTFFF